MPKLFDFAEIFCFAHFPLTLLYVIMLSRNFRYLLEWLGIQHFMNFIWFLPPSKIVCNVITDIRMNFRNHVYDP